MSFTIDLIVTELPSDDKKAWSFIDGMREEYYEDKSGTHPKLKDLHEILTKKYPCLCSFEDDDPAMDDSPWADSPMINNFASKMGMVSIVWSKADEVFPFVLESALSLGIIVADGQSEVIYRPGYTVETKSKPWWKFW
ncbi:hypothetical protein L9G74_18180 [Shewanella sp. C32]|uniref:Uncharacterized protein n=1 Tax=Shewanella electrica TaxID=515560 RepID=A0ABT2FPU9_9GAMM|nr:hypothetical protein [Shewanella electrica]MCH1926808.1 hypothetical protein [Shewanella electrica]MCS4558369.1 hypothetical protein [Shewanella electrica]